MIKRINTVLSIIALTFAILLVVLKSNVVMSKGNVMLEVYSKYNFDVLQINLRSTGILNIKELNENKICNIINNVLLKLEIYDNVTIDKVETDNFNNYKFVKDAKDAKIEIEIINDSQKVSLKINAILYENENALLYLQDKIKEIYQENEIKPEINITVIGTYNKKFTNEEKKSIVKKILACVKANVIKEYVNERLYSAYGYTKLIKDYEDVDGDKVNMHVAIRYNEYENRTYLYIASPVISVDY